MLIGVANISASASEHTSTTNQWVHLWVESEDHTKCKAFNYNI